VEAEGVALRRTAETLSRPTSDRLRWACGPTTPVLDDGGAFHRALTEVAEAHGVPLHAHVHPIEGSLGPGETAASLVRRLGLVRAGNWFAHGSRLTTTDVAELGAAGVGLVHAPSCSVLLGYPIPPLAAWWAVNDRIAVAVDGGASNDRGNMLLEAQLAWQLQRAVHAATGADGASDVFEMTTEGAARTIGWPGLGRLEPGGPADLAVLDLAGLEHGGVPAAARGDVASSLLRTYAGGRIRHLLVGDRIVVEDGRLTGVDETAVAVAANEAAQRLYG
jgi:cytosine/adenosine deaminase-related metal-dependent hydrolase